MATSPKKFKWSTDLDYEIFESAPKLRVTRNDYLEILYQTRVKIQDHFKNIQKSAQELESKLLNELDEYAEMHRNMLLETNSAIKQTTLILNTLTDPQIKENFYNNIDLLNMQKYINIDVNVEQKLSDYMNKSISINIEMASDTNLKKVRSSNPHPVMHYRKVVSKDTFHEQLDEIKTLLAEPQYLEQGKIWYLIGRKWVEQFINYRTVHRTIKNSYDKIAKPVNGMIPIPPPIDNSDIMDDDRSRILKYHRKCNTIHVHKNNECITEELVMGRDFAIFNEAAWGKLVEWYGIKEETIKFPRPVLPRDKNECVNTTNISLCLYPNASIFKFQLFSNISFLYLQLHNPIKEIRFFHHDTDLERLTAVKRALGIPLSSEIIIFREDYKRTYREVNGGTRIHPITNKKYTVMSSIVPSSIRNFLCRTVPIYLVAVKSKETEWLYV